MELSQAVCFSHQYWDLLGSLRPFVSMFFPHTSECHISSSDVNVMKDLLCARPRNMPLDPPKSPIRSSLFSAPSYREIRSSQRGSNSSTVAPLAVKSWARLPDYSSTCSLDQLEEESSCGLHQVPSFLLQRPQKTIHGNRKRQIPATLI